jgi:hypothetical protein
MIVLLLTLLAIALVVTLTGLFLTYRSYEPGMPWVSFPSSPRTGARGNGSRRFEQNRNMRMRRSMMRRRTGAWTNIAALLNIKNLFVIRAGAQTPWLGITLILMVLFLAGSFLLSSTLPSSALVNAPWANALVTANIPGHASSLRIAQQKAPAPAPAAVVNASKKLVRLYQLSSDQYNSTDEYNSWAYAACSAAAMTEVVNSYGHNYRITDILKVEAAIGEITPDLGLIEPVGIDKTVAKFGFKTRWLGDTGGTTLDEVIKVANSGNPVIVAWPPALWDGGHVLVVRGGDSDNVFLADSSRYNFTTLSRDVFMQRWLNTFAAVVEPK